MKQILKNWMLTIAIIGVGAFDLLADSSHVSNYLFTADGMHQQEVLLTLEIVKDEPSNNFLIIKKSADGLRLKTVAEFDLSQITGTTLVIADHLYENTPMQYYLVEVDARGEEVISTISYDPNQIEPADVILGSDDKLDSGDLLQDPHSM